MADETLATGETIPDSFPVGQAPWDSAPPTESEPIPPPAESFEVGKAPWDAPEPPKAEMDVKPVQDYVAANLKKNLPAIAPTAGDATAQKGTPENPEQADSFLKSIEAGYEISVNGLLARKKMPSVVVPENAGLFYKIASQVGTLAGDLPYMIVGGMAGVEAGAVTGATTGAAVGVVGGVAGIAAGAVAGGGVGAMLGGGAGAMALPAGLRRIIIDHYQKGDIKDFEDFWSRSAGAFIEAGKAGIVGAATAGAGAGAGKILGPAVNPLVKTTSTLMSEVMTMTTVGKALDGQVPKASDFAEAAILVGGLHAVGAISEFPLKGTEAQKTTSAKLANIWAKTGITPSEIAMQSQTDPLLRQELLSDKPIPSRYEDLVLSGDRPNTVEGIHPDLLKANPALGEDAKSSTLSIEPLPKGEEGVSPQSTTQKKVETPTPEEAVLSRIASEISPSKKKFDFNTFYANKIDDLDPAKQFVKAIVNGETLPTSKDPYKIFRLTRGYGGIVKHFMEYGSVDWHTGETNGKSLKEILAPVSKDQATLESFKAYAVASRGLELEARGIPSGIVKEGITTEDLQKVVSDGSARFKEHFENLVDFQNKSLQYLKDSGRLSEKAYSTIVEANKNYIPFDRLFSEDENVGSGKTKGLGNPIKSIKGSERQIVDPIETIVKNTNEYVRLAEQNRGMLALADLANSSPYGKGLMEKVPAKMQAIQVRESEIAKFFNEHGIDADPETLTIFRPDILKLRADEIPVFRDGKPEIYRVGPEMASIMKALEGDKVSIGLFDKLMRYPARLLRASLSLTPDFQLRNFFRDQITAGSFSEGRHLPVVDTVKAMGSLMKDDVHYQNWLKSGGATVSFNEINSDYLDKNIYSLQEKTGFLNSAMNVVKSPLESIRVASELIENSTRLAEFKRVAGENPTKEQSLTAGFSSREVTVDFQRIGAQMRALNAITAFQNVGIQGLDRTVRAIKERPTETLARATALITMPSVLLWYANHKDPRYSDIPQWQKDNFWLVFTKDHIYRFPKPQELGLVFGAIPERVLDKYFGENPEALKGFGESMANVLVPNYMPTVASPIVEQFANRSLFTDNKIVPAKLEDISAQYQYNDYTTETSKVLSKALSFLPPIGTDNGLKLQSPMVIENYIRGWSGNTGMYALKLTDQLLMKAHIVPDPVKPASTLADMPFIKAFVVRYPSGNAESIKKFYDSYGETQELTNTLEYLKSTQQMGEYEKQLKLEENQPKLVKLNEIQKAIASSNAEIQMINQMPKMTPDEKRQQIDLLYYSMIQSAKIGNKMVSEVRKSLKDIKK